MNSSSVVFLLSRNDEVKLFKEEVAHTNQLIVKIKLTINCEV